jgi:hypothetical protein
VCSYRSVAEARSATESEAAPAPTPCQQLVKHVWPHTLVDSARECEAAPALTRLRTCVSICTFVLIKQVKRGPGATRSRTRATAS